MPRWRFRAADYAAWIFYAILVVMAALAVATIIFMLTDYDWDVYRNLHRGAIANIFYAVPYFWLAILAFFAALAYYDFRRTKRGYRYNVVLTVGGTTFLSLVLGVLLFYAGFDSQANNVLSQVPVYNALTYGNNDLWNNADEGLLGGEIIDTETKDDFTIVGLDGNFWRVFGNNLNWHDQSLPQKGVKIKLIGHIGTDHDFMADTVRAWYGR